MLVPDGVRKIVAFLLKSPFEEFNINQISRASGVSVGTTFNTLKDLEKPEILISKKRANSLFYTLNFSDPVCLKLCELTYALHYKELIKKKELNNLINDLTVIGVEKADNLFIKPSGARINVYALCKEDNLSKVNTSFRKTLKGISHIHNKKIFFDAVSRNEFLSSLLNKKGRGFELTNNYYVINNFSTLLNLFSDAYTEIRRNFFQ